VLDTVTERTSRKCYKNGGAGGPGVLLGGGGGTSSRLMAADKTYSDIYDFYIVHVFKINNSIKGLDRP
jgi:hypothetical protein